MKVITIKNETKQKTKINYRPEMSKNTKGKKKKAGVKSNRQVSQ